MRSGADKRKARVLTAGMSAANVGASIYEILMRMYNDDDDCDNDDDDVDDD